MGYQWCVPSPFNISEAPQTSTTNYTLRPTKFDWMDPIINSHKLVTVRLTWKRSIAIIAIMLLFSLLLWLMIGLCVLDHWDEQPCSANWLQLHLLWDHLQVLNSFHLSVHSTNPILASDYHAARCMLIRMECCCSSSKTRVAILIRSTLRECPIPTVSWPSFTCFLWLSSLKLKCHCCMSGLSVFWAQNTNIKSPIQIYYATKEESQFIVTWYRLLLLGTKAVYS